MSCGPCNCDDCKVDRLEEEPRPLKAGWRTPSWRDVPVANEVQAKAWMAIINGIYDDHKIKSVSLPAMIGMVANQVPGLRPENYYVVSAGIERFIRESPEFELRRGKSGGVFRKESNPCNNPSYFGMIKSGTLPAPIPNVVSVTLADNYTCKGCGNTKLNNTEKSCWSCGREVGT